MLVCVLLAAGSAYAFARRQAKEYTATASVLFSTNQLGPIASGLNPNPPVLDQSQLDTNVQLVRDTDVAAKAAARLGPRWSAGMVKGAISVSGSGDTSIVDVSAKAGNPAGAQQLANTYVTTFVAQTHKQSLAQIRAAERLVNDKYNALPQTLKEGGVGFALADRAQSLAVLAKLENGNVSVAGLAPRPTSPSSPKVTRIAVLGGILGLLIGIVIALVLERVNRRIRDPKDLEAAYGLPLLAAVPERSDYRVLKSFNRSKSLSRSSPYDETFKLLRSYLPYYGDDRDIKSLLVISAEPGDGKTTVCFNLAKAAAGLGSRVLLIECDLRRGTVIGPLLKTPGPTLVNVLIGDASPPEAIRSIRVGDESAVDVLIAGEAPPLYAGKLIESQAMESLLEGANRNYDLVVIDTPPLSVVADAVALLTKVDGVIVVGRVGTSRWEAARRLREKLTSVGAPLLGVVANGIHRDPGTYHRRYRSNYYGSKAAVDFPSTNRSASSNGTERVVGVTAPSDSD